MEKSLLTLYEHFQIDNIILLVDFVSTKIIFDFQSTFTQSLSFAPTAKSHSVQY